MLDLTACYELKKFPPYVIQRLSQLEELFIDFLSLNLSELNSLPCLVMLSLKLVLVRLPKALFSRTFKDITYRLTTRPLPNFLTIIIQDPLTQES